MPLHVLLVVLLLNAAQGAEVGPWDQPTQHQITGIISFSTPTTLVITDFSFDGLGFSVFLYYYAPGQAVDASSGTILPFSGGGSRGDLNRAFNNELLVVELPAGVTACDMGALTVWCEQFEVTFSQVSIPSSLFITDGASGSCELVGGNTDLPNLPPTTFDNCVPFSDSLQVSWTVDTDNNEVDFQICSCRPLEADINNYMGFGLSGSPTSTFMVGADATIAWVDNSMGMPNAVDYFLTGRFQCRAGEGACPDALVTRDGQQCTDDVRNGSVFGGIRNGNEQCVTFSRPFSPSDSTCDMPIDTTNVNQYIVWAIGGLGETAFIHFSRADPDSPPIHLGRDPLDQCSSGITCSSCSPFEGQRREVMESTTLRVRIGPSAGERGYMGITNQAGWGIAWYVDDVLIPELVVQRGKNYTFIVEGGDDPSDVANYHPFYITDSINGGRLLNTPEQRASERVFAGFDEDDNPVGVGRLCQVSESQAAGTIRDTCGSMEDYLAELRNMVPQCSTGEAGTFTWTPDDSTPDEVFYQCASHRNLGWRITVMSASLVDNGGDGPVVDDNGGDGGDGDTMNIDGSNGGLSVVRSAISVIVLLSILSSLLTS